MVAKVRTTNRVSTGPRKRLQLSPRQRQVREAMLEFVANLRLTRQNLAGLMAGSGLDANNRDLDKECGYPACPNVSVYRKMWDRWGIARRVVSVLPDECWAVYPQVYETEKDKNTRFERAWKDLNKRIPVCHYLHRADVLSGIGAYGVLLLGLDDGPLDKPVAGINPRTGERKKKRPVREPKLMYLRAFSSEFCRISKKVDDSTSPRNGMPEYYSIDLQAGQPDSDEGQLKKVRVHWTRVLHLADNRESSETSGVPRMQPVLNYLLDLRKLGGGSAEMFWKGAFPGYSFETLPEMVGESTMYEDEVKEQFENYMEGLQRYLALEGVTAKPLLPQTADPTAHANLQLTLIAATLAIPMRMLIGSEMGHLASTQDVSTFNKRISQRQVMYVEPMILRPFIDRLILIGVLPAPAEGDYIISWKDLNTMSDKDKALVSLQRSQALMQYVSGGCEAVIPVKEYLTLVLGFTLDEANAIEDSLKKNKEKLTDPLDEKKNQFQAQTQKDLAKISAKASIQAAKLRPRPTAKPQGGGRRGKPARKPAGRPTGRVPKGTVG